MRPLLAILFFIIIATACGNRFNNLKEVITSVQSSASTCLSTTEDSEISGKESRVEEDLPELEKEIIVTPSPLNSWDIKTMFW